MTSGTVTLNLPTPVRYVLTIVATILAVINQATLALGPSLSTYITVGLLFLASVGIPPVLGPAFQSFLAKILPVAWLQTVHTLVALAIAGATLGVTNNVGSPGVRALVAGVATMLVGLGFGPDGVKVPAIP